MSCKVSSFDLCCVCFFKDFVIESRVDVVVFRVSQLDARRLQCLGQRPCLFALEHGAWKCLAGSQTVGRPHIGRDKGLGVEKSTYYEALCYWAGYHRDILFVRRMHYYRMCTRGATESEWGADSRVRE